ncbi:hypothetical protein FOL47_005906 [Perkinsus chesapeaki]|uniref:RAP domain-containing protein n=1 Tax=Perkinsus chesapeaki TaxID=330153 RepID=A0A7J6LV33_PERCH|nr:hypothetical protein FOL47_005906 [Perkinsus chesapeaki]
MSLSSSKLEKIQKLCLEGSHRRAVDMAIPPKGPVRGALVHAMLTGLAGSLGPGEWTDDEHLRTALKRAFVDNGGRGFSQRELFESKEAMLGLGITIPVPTTAVAWRKPSTPTRIAAHEVTTIINRKAVVDQTNLAKLIVGALEGTPGSSRDVATLVWGCGRLGVASSKDISMILWGWAKMGNKALEEGGGKDEADDTVVIWCIEKLTKMYCGLSGIELTNVIWALARLRVYNTIFTLLLNQAVLDVSLELSPTSVSSVVWASGARMSTIGELPTAEVMKSLHHLAISSILSMDPPCIASTIWGLGALGILLNEGNVLPYQPLTAIEDSIQDFDMDNMKSILQYTWTDPSVTACLAPELIRRFEASSSSSSSSIPPWCRSIAEICLYMSRGALQSPKELAEVIQLYLDKVELDLSHMAPVDAARLVAAFSNLSYIPSHHTLSFLINLADLEVSRFFPNTYCMYTIALAQLNQAGHRVPLCEADLTIDQSCSLIWASAILDIQGIDQVIRRLLQASVLLPSLPFARQAIAGLWARGMKDEAERLIGAYATGSLTEATDTSSSSSSSLHLDISQTLRSMGYSNIKDEIELCGVYKADVVIPDLRIVIECDGDVHHLYSNDTGDSETLIGSSVIRDKVFNKAGWHVIRVSIKAWRKCRTSNDKQALLRRLLAQFRT